MLVPEFKETVSLLESYMGKRPRRGPFPIESTFTWSALLSAQACNEIRGDMLEIGVEFGTSAFRMLEVLRAKEHATCIDLAMTDEWREGIERSYRAQTNYTYILANTLNMARAELPSGCRWIHIDGGHLYRHVANDLELTVDSLADKGIIVLDDFFEIRWPDVTVAVLDYLKSSKKIVPFLLVNRKLYCARTADSASAYKTAFCRFLAENSDQIGQVRCWNDVSLLGEQVVVAKMDLSPQLRALEAL